MGPAVAAPTGVRGRDALTRGLVTRDWSLGTSDGGLVNGDQGVGPRVTAFAGRVYARIGESEVVIRYC